MHTENEEYLTIDMLSKKLAKSYFLTEDFSLFKFLSAHEQPRIIKAEGFPQALYTESLNYLHDLLTDPPENQKDEGLLIENIKGSLRLFSTPGLGDNILEMYARSLYTAQRKALPPMHSKILYVICIPKYLMRSSPSFISPIYPDLDEMNCQRDLESKEAPKKNLKKQTIPDNSSLYIEAQGYKPLYYNLDLNTLEFDSNCLIFRLTPHSRKDLYDLKQNVSEVITAMKTRQKAILSVFYPQQLSELHFELDGLEKSLKKPYRKKRESPRF